MLVNEGKYVFVDDSTRQAYESDETGQTRPLTATASDLPSTIRLIGRLSTGGIITADDDSGSLGEITDDGMVDAGKYDPRSWQPTCSLADGTLIGRSRSLPIPPGSLDLEARIRRDTARYSARTRNEHLRPIAVVAGDETVRLPMQNGQWRSLRSVPVIFGHKTLTACSRNYFVIVQTNNDAAVFVDRTGDTIFQSPLPGYRRSVSLGQIDAERRLVVLADHRYSRIERRRYSYLAKTTGLQIFFPDLVAADMLPVPANDVAPPVDELFVDASDRIWFRLLPMPADDSVYWHVRDVGQQEVAFRVKVHRQVDVVDAYNDRVLLRTTSLMGQDRLLVTSMIRYREHGQLPASGRVRIKHHSTQEEGKP